MLVEHGGLGAIGAFLVRRLESSECRPFLDSLDDDRARPDMRDDDRPVPGPKRERMFSRLRLPRAPPLEFLAALRRGDEDELKWKLFRTLSIGGRIPKLLRIACGGLLSSGSSTVGTSYPSELRLPR